jgi:hypothetical protein
VQWHHGLLFLSGAIIIRFTSSLLFIVVIIITIA